MPRVAAPTEEASEEAMGTTERHIVLIDAERIVEFSGSDGHADTLFITAPDRELGVLGADLGSDAHLVARTWFGSSPVRRHYLRVDGRAWLVAREVLRDRYQIDIADAPVAYLVSDKYSIDIESPATEVLDELHHAMRADAVLTAAIGPGLSRSRNLGGRTVGRFLSVDFFGWPSSVAESVEAHLALATRRFADTLAADPSRWRDPNRRTSRLFMRHVYSPPPRPSREAILRGPSPDVFLTGTAGGRHRLHPGFHRPGDEIPGDDPAYAHEHEVERALTYLGLPLPADPILIRLLAVTVARAERHASFYAQTRRRPHGSTMPQRRALVRGDLADLESEIELYRADGTFRRERMLAEAYLLDPAAAVAMLVRYGLVRDAGFPDPSLGSFSIVASAGVRYDPDLDDAQLQAFLDATRFEFATGARGVDEAHELPIGELALAMDASASAATSILLKRGLLSLRFAPPAPGGERRPLLRPATTISRARTIEDSYDATDRFASFIEARIGSLGETSKRYARSGDRERAREAAAQADDLRELAGGVCCLIVSPDESAAALDATLELVVDGRLAVRTWRYDASVIPGDSPRELLATLAVRFPDGHAAETLLADIAALVADERGLVPDPYRR